MTHPALARCYMEDQTFIFIAGLHRSGTSVLFRILREHPEISGFKFETGAEREHEGQHLQSVYAPDTEHGGPGYFAFDPGAHLTESSDLANETNRQVLFREWGKYWDLSCPYLLEKSPTNLVRSRFLQKLFQRSKFIVIARHPIAVSLAMIKWMGWPRHYVTHSGGPSGVDRICVRAAQPTDREEFWASRQLYTESMVYTLLCHWCVAHERFLSDAPRLTEAVSVRYEDLVRRPSQILIEILQFIGATGSLTGREEVFEDHNAGYFSQWEGMLGTLISRPFFEHMLVEFGPVARQFGYDLSATGSAVGSGALTSERRRKPIQ